MRIQLLLVIVLSLSCATDKYRPETTEWDDDDKVVSKRIEDTQPTTPNETLSSATIPPKRTETSDTSSSRWLATDPASCACVSAIVVPAN